LIERLERLGGNNFRGIGPNSQCLAIFDDLPVEHIVGADDHLNADCAARSIIEVDQVAIMISVRIFSCPRVEEDFPASRLPMIKKGAGLVAHPHGIFPI